MSTSYNAIAAYMSAYNKKLQEEQTEQNKAIADAALSQISQARGDMNARVTDAVRQAYTLRDQANAKVNPSGASETMRLRNQLAAENSAASIEQQRENLNAGFDVSELRAKANALKAESDNSTVHSNADKLLSLKMAQMAQNRYDAANAEELYKENINQYQNNFQAEINRLRNAGVSDDDYRIKALSEARQEKIQKSTYLDELAEISRASGLNYDFDSDIFQLEQMGYTSDDWQIQYLKEAKRIQTRDLKALKKAESTAKKKKKSSGGSSGSDDDMIPKSVDNSENNKQKEGVNGKDFKGSGYASASQMARYRTAISNMVSGKSEKHIIDKTYEEIASYVKSLENREMISEDQANQLLSSVRK